MKATKPQLFKTATDTFTDREEPRRAFWKLYRGMETGDIEVLHFYGTGGIGKTTLLKKLQSEMKEENISDFLYYNFENIKPKAEILADFARLLSERLSGLRFPIFEYAYLKYKQTSGEDVNHLQEQQAQTFLDNEHVENVMGVVSELVPGFGLLSTSLKSGARITKSITQKYEQTSGKNSSIFNQINNSTSAELLHNLQKYMAYDAYDYFEGLSHPFVIMLDGYEALVNKLEKGEKASSDDLWLREEESLVRSMPNVLWVIAGREKLDWESDILEPHNTHIIGNLSEADSIDFFRKSGVKEETLRKDLYELTAGTPVFMDLCIKTYQSIKNREGAQYLPNIEDFGHNTEELAARYLKDMSISEQNLVKLISCLPNIWNDEMVEAIAKKLKIDFSQGEYRLIKELSLVENDENDPSYYKLHETFRKVVVARIKDEEYTENVIVIGCYMLDKLTDLDSLDPKLYSQLASCLSYAKQHSDHFFLETSGVENLLDCIDRLHVLISEEECLHFLNELQEALYLMRNDETELNKDIVLIQNLKIKILCKKYKYAAALELAKKNYYLAKDCYEAGHSEIFHAIQWYASACVHNEVYEDARTLCQEALKLAERNSDISLHEQSVILQILYNNEKYSSSTEQLAELANKRIALCKQIYEQNKEKYQAPHDNLVTDLRRIYHTYYDIGKYEEALQISHDIYQMSMDLDPEDHQAILFYYLCQNNCLSMMDEDEKAQEISKKLLKLSCDLYGEQHLYTLEAKDTLAASLYDSEDYEEAAELYLQVYNGYMSLFGENRWETMSALKDLADTYWLLEQYDDQVENMYLKVYHYASEKFGKDDIDALDALKCLVDVYYYQGNYQQTLDTAKEAYDGYSKRYGRDSQEAIDVSLFIAHSLLKLKRPQEALVVYEENVTILQKQENPDTRSLADNLYGAGRCHSLLSQYDQAVNCYLQQFALEETEDLASGMIAGVMLGLGHCYLKLQKFEDAIQWIEKLYALQIERFGETDSHTVFVASFLSQIYEEKKDYKKARDLIKWCYETSQELQGEDAEDTLRALGSYGWLECELENYESAKVLLELYYQKCVKIYGAEHQMTAKAIMHFSNFYEAQNQYDIVIKMREQALCIVEKDATDNQKLLDIIKAELEAAKTAQATQ